MPSPSVKGEEPDEDEQTTDEEDVEDVEGEEVEEQTGGGEETPEEDEEEVDVEEAELPDDDGKDDEDDSSGGSLLSGSTLGVSNKVLLGVGIAAILLVLLLRSADANSSTRSYEGDEQVEEEVEEGSDGVVEKDVTDAGGSATKFDQDAQDDAIGEVFG